MKLNLGCGLDVREQWVNIDRRAAPGINLIMDIAKEPLPFANDSVDEVLASHVLEHIAKWEEVLLEIHRVLRPGGLLTVKVPYGINPGAWHVRAFFPSTLDYFIENRVTGYGPCGYGHSGLDVGWSLFRQLERKVNRIFPFGWHIHHYLKITPPLIFPIGRKHEIVWRLQKLNGGR